MNANYTREFYGKRDVEHRDIGPVNALESFEQSRSVFIQRVTPNVTRDVDPRQQLR